VHRELTAAPVDRPTDKLPLLAPRCSPRYSITPIDLTPHRHTSGGGTIIISVLHAGRTPHCAHLALPHSPPFIPFPDRQNQMAVAPEHNAVIINIKTGVSTSCCVAPSAGAALKKPGREIWVNVSHRPLTDWK